MRYPNPNTNPNPNPAYIPQADSSSVPHTKPKLFSDDLDIQTPHRSPDDDYDDDEIQTGAGEIQRETDVVVSSFCYGQLESDDNSAGSNPRIIIDSKTEQNQINVNKDYNTKTSTIKKIKNFFQRLCCVFFKTPAPIEPLDPSMEASSLGVSPPNSIEESPRGASPAPIEPLDPSMEVSSLGVSPPNSIVDSSREASHVSSIESPRATYPGVSPAPSLCLNCASSPRGNSPNSLSVFEKIEMFNYLDNAAKINFDKLIEDESKVNCYEALLNEVNDEKAGEFIEIYTKNGHWNSIKNSIVEIQKINEKQGSDNDKIKIKLFNLINEKLKFNEDDLTDDKRIDIANFFIKGLIYKKKDIIKKINKVVVGAESRGR